MLMSHTYRMNMNYENRIKVSLFRNSSNLRSFKQGDVIFNKGDPGKEMFVVRSGTVDLRVGNKTVVTLEHDEVFGEMALVDNQPRSASAIAASDCELAVVDGKNFLFLVGETPSFALQMLQVLASRLRQTNSSL